MNKIPLFALAISIFLYSKIFTKMPKDFVVAPKTSFQKEDSNLILQIEFDEKYKNGTIVIKKKPIFSERWELLDTLLKGMTFFFDTLPINSLSEFGFHCSVDSLDSFGYFLIGEKSSVETYLGNVLIIVDSTIFDGIQPQLKEFVEDLENEGWFVELRKSPRAENFNPIEIRKVKRIVNSYKRNWKEKFKVLLLVGRVPVPYTGNYTFDGHSDHFGAFPSDLFYVIDDSLLTDEVEYNTTAERQENWNLPFDGKFDQTTIPGKISCAVGRIDFSNLTAFKESEVNLIRKYFEKNHNFRLGKNSNNNGIIDDGFGNQSPEMFSANAYMNFYALADTIVEGKLFENISQRYFRYAYACNSGSYTSIWSSINSEQCASSNIQTTFLFLFGSYNWDWDTENNLLRSALASSPDVLITAWIGRPFWHLHHFAFGFPFCFSFISTANNHELYQSTGKYGYKGMHLEVMGDPTLRENYPEPVDVFRGEIDNNRIVKLIWGTPKDTNNLLGYQILKKEFGKTEFTPIANISKHSSSFTDTNTQKGIWIYQIKALYLRTNKFGSYLNPSIGQRIEIEIK
ncbi:MAG: hypothetical protein ACPLPX_03575 [Candidatus Kapaibacteriota bacterium]